MPINYTWMSRTLGLVLGDELWNDLTAHPAYGSLTLWLARWHREDQAKFYLTITLLSEVVQAAEAISYAADGLRAKLDETQQRLDAFIARGGRSPDGYSDVPVEHARIEFVNLVTWARTLRDRLNQRASSGHLGLLPAMNPAHPATTEVLRLIDRLTSDALTDASRLASFGLHISVWPYPRAGLPVDRDGRVVFRVPDPLPGRTYSPWLLTYDKDREARPFAAHLEAAVGEFMDDLLTVYETASRDRWDPSV